MTNDKKENWLEIGTIVAPQGLKGELKVLSSSDFPERFERGGKRWLQSPNSLEVTQVELLKGRYLPGKDLYVVTLAEIENREAAEALRGYKLLVPQSDRPQLEADEYHVSELIDLEVYNQLNGEKIGIVSNVMWAGNDLLEVKLDREPVLEETSLPDLSKITRISKRRKFKPKKPKPVTILIPFVKAIVTSVDIQQKRIEIVPPSGLLELNQ